MFGVVVVVVVAVIIVGGGGSGGGGVVSMVVRVAIEVLQRAGTERLWWLVSRHGG